MSNTKLSPDQYSDMGRRILRFMATEGLNKSTLAKKIGINRTTLYDWMSGRTTPRIDQALKLAAALGLITDEVDSEQRGRAIEKLYGLEHMEIPSELQSVGVFTQSQGIEGLSPEQIQKIVMKGVAQALADVYLKNESVAKRQPEPSNKDDSGHDR